MVSNARCISSQWHNLDWRGEEVYSVLLAKLLKEFSQISMLLILKSLREPQGYHRYHTAAQGTGVTQMKKRKQCRLRDIFLFLIHFQLMLFSLFHMLLVLFWICQIVCRWVRLLRLRNLTVKRLSSFSN